MSSAVIVALPAVDERVYKVSSEKVPHLTLVSLGDQFTSDQLIDIVTFTEHAASQLSPFGLSVDYRGELGENAADVLFFEEHGWASTSRISQFRAHLLQQDSIRRAYEESDQFPVWRPHLTLGFPETPAHEDDVDHGIHHVSFDRIAVWIDDYDGPEFRLKYDDYGMDVAMSDMTTAELGQDAVDGLFHDGVESTEEFINELFHYGKMGMKWGVRRAEHSQRQATALQKRADKSAAKATRNQGKLGNSMTIRDAKKKQKVADRQQKYADKLAGKQAKKADARAAKADSKWEQSIYTAPGAVAVHNAMAEHFNERIGSVNDKHPDANLDHPDSPETKAYMADVMALETKSYSSAVTSVHGSSPSGRKEAVFVDDEKGARIEVHNTSIKHAEPTDSESDLILLLKLDDNGRISEMNKADLAVSHGDVDDFLAHYGKKGMKWGVTTVDKAAGVTVQQKPGKYAKTSGGKDHPLHPDAVPALVAKQKAKSSTTDSLSNDELRKANERLQLEANFNKLVNANDRRSRGARFAAGLFGVKRDTKTDVDTQSGEQIRKAADDIFAAKKAARERADQK